ncbi:MAG: type II secretion system inner membrane protein GspF [Desulfatiglandaceae bacterium]
MPVYEYTALDRAGKTTKGIVDADSPQAARQKLRGSGIYPVEVKESGSSQKESPGRSISMSARFSRVSSAEVTAATRQLAILIGAGVNLVAALDALMAQSGNPAFKRVMAQVKESVNVGNSLAHALSQHPKLFSQIYVNMVRAGEASGSLEMVLARLADFSESQQALTSRFKAALAYPILMMLIGSLILFFLITFIVPNITRIFVEMQQTLPLPTVFLIGASSFLKSFWWLLLGAAAGILVAASRIVKSERGRRIWDEIRLRAPLMGGIQIRMAMARFGRTLGSLLRSGVPVLTALTIVRNIVNNNAIADAIDDAMENIGQGTSIAGPLSRSRWFPPMVVQMISVGEQSGELEGMLDKIADVYEREAENRLMAMTSILEPLMILVMGVVVGFIVISILLPIFEMNQMIR